MTYEENKERIREIAGEWSIDLREHSFWERVEMQAFFRKYGKKYGLLEEFEEDFIPC